MLLFLTLLWSWDSCCWSMRKHDRFPIVSFAWRAFLASVRYLLSWHTLYNAESTDLQKKKMKLFLSLLLLSLTLLFTKASADLVIAFFIVDNWFIYYSFFYYHLHLFSFIGISIILDFLYYHYLILFFYFYFLSWNNCNNSFL